MAESAPNKSLRLYQQLHDLAIFFPSEPGLRNGRLTLNGPPIT